MKKRILSTLLALCMCLSLLPTAALAGRPSGVNYIDEQGATKTLEEFNRLNSDTDSLESGFYATDYDYTLGSVSVASGAKLILSADHSLTIGSLTGTEGSLSIYGGKYAASLTGNDINSGTCSIASISGVTVTLYGGTYTSLPESGWALGENFRFRTGTSESDYKYSTTFTAGATVVKQPEATSANAASVTTSSGSTTEYPTFNAAYEAAQSGDTIKLLADEVTFASTNVENPKIRKSITLDLDGKKLIGQYRRYSDGALTDGDVTVSNNAEVTIKGHGTIGGDGLLVDSGTLTLNGVTVSENVKAFGGKLIVRNAAINHLYAGNSYTYPSNTVEIKGGTIQAMDVYANAKVTLSDVEVGNIARKGVENVPTYAEMLKTGYAYQFTTGTKEYIKLSEISGQDHDAALVSVKAVKCANEHDAVTPCEYCGGVETHIHCVCNGATLPTEAGHTCDTEKDFTAWTSTTSLPTAAGRYYLKKDVTLSAKWTVSADITLCLNGHSITASVDDEAIFVDDGKTFLLTDCAATPGKITHAPGKTGSGVYNSGTFCLYGGAITGNSGDSYSDGTSGGGVNNSGIFQMYGGSITGNSVTQNGGGVDNSGSGCAIYLYGGEITGNSARLGGGVYSNTFHMTGGSIKGNTATYGGGVCNLYTFTMTGGSITGNNATSDIGDNCGGGVCNMLTFTVGGTANITGNVLNGTKGTDGTYSGGTNSNVQACWYSPLKPAFIVRSGFTGTVGVSPLEYKEGSEVLDLATNGLTAVPSGFTLDDPTKGLFIGSDGKLAVHQHTDANGDNKCDDTTCGKALTVKRTHYDTKLEETVESFYTTLSEALSAKVSTDTMRDIRYILLTDCTDTTALTFSFTCTLDLNGHICANSVKVTDCLLTIRDDTADADSGKYRGDGKLTGTVTVERSTADTKLWLKNVTVDRVDVNNSGLYLRSSSHVGTLTFTGRDTDYLDAGENYAESACRVDTLTVNSGNVALENVSLGKLINATTDQSLEDFLGSAFSPAYWDDTDGKWLKLADLTDKTELSNVTAKRCDHKGNTGSPCDFCGETGFVAKLTHGTDSTAYMTFNAAYEAAQSGDTITLLADVNLNDLSSWSKSLDLDLGGHTLSSTGMSSVMLSLGTYTFKNGTVKFSLIVANNTTLKLGDNFTLANDGVRKKAVYLSGCTLDITGNNVSVTELSVTKASNYPLNCSLSKGTFGTITCKGGVSVADLLADGYAFKTTSGNTWYDKNNNSDATNISNVTVTKAPITKVELTPNKASYTYGETVELSATVTTPTAYTGEIEFGWYLDNGGQNVVFAHESTITIRSEELEGLSAGAHTFRIEATIDGYTAKSDTLPVNISKATIPGFNGPKARSNLTYDGGNRLLIDSSDTVWDTIEALLSDREIELEFRVGETGEWNGYPVATDAGTYTVYWYLDGGTNYQSFGSAEEPESVEVTIAPKPVTPTVTVADGGTYDGSEKKPTVTVTADSKTLTENTDFTVSYSNNVNAGENTASVTVTAKDGSNYTWTEPVTQNFTIQKADAPTLAGVTVQQVYTKTTGTADLTGITGIPADAGAVSYALGTLPAGVTDASIDRETMTLSFTLNGSGKANDSYDIPVTVSSKNYQTATVTVTVKLIAKTTHNDLAVTMQNWTYGDTAKTPQFTTPDGTTETEIRYWKVYAGGGTGQPTETAPTDAGNYQVLVKCETPTDIWYGTADFTVSPKNINDKTVNISVLSGLTYSGTSQKPTVTVMDGTETLLQRTGEELTAPDYNLSGDISGTNADTYTVTITGEGNYQGSVEKTWSIDKAPLTVSVTAADKTYDGSTAATISAVTFTGLQNSETLTKDTDYTVTAEFADANYNWENHTTVSYAVTLKDSATAKNYSLSTGTGTTTAKIQAKTVTATITVADKEYDGTTNAAVTVTVDKTDLCGDDSITATGLTGTFSDANVGKNKTVTIEGVLILTGKGADNYMVTYLATATASIKAAKSTVATVPTANTLTYNGTAQALVTAGSVSGGTMQYSLDGNAWSDSVPTGTNATGYTVWYKAKGDSNHSDSDAVSIPVTIGRAALTVTANDKAITYGEAPANSGVTYSGFVGGETESVLTGTLGYDYSYTQYGNVGSSYTITPNGLTSSNYDISFQSGTLTVTQKEVGLSWTNTSLTYTGSAQKPTATATGLVNGDSCTLTVEGEQTNAGTGYAATVTGLSNSNYKLPESGLTASFSIAAASLTDVSVKQSGTLTYNGSAQTATVTTTATPVDSGAVNFTYSDAENGDYSTAVPSFTSGTHTVWYKASAADHVTASGSFTVTIGKATVTITAANRNARTNVYAPDLSSPVEGKDYTLSGLIGEDTLDTVTVVLTCDADMSKTGSYDIVPSVNGEDVRYDFAFVNGKLTVSNQPSGSSSTSTTVKNPDGSTTTTVTDKKTGTVTETTKNTDGSTTTVETKKDGTVTETTTTVGGTTSTTVTDKDGNSTTNVSVSKKDTQSGETVTLPVDEVKPASKSEDATEIIVKVPSGGATIEIPVKNPTPGTVIVIVDKNGNETILPDSKVTENGIEIKLTEDATIKVIENSKDFSDVKDSDYFGKAVDWASSRGITGGTGNDLFAPDASCTRAQIVTFLWRAAGSPEPKTASSFADVPANAYYAKAVAWAVENGITGGIGNDQFAPDLTCTRAQAVAFLFRYAAASGMEAVTLQELVGGYSDAASVPGYALSAFNWALAQGIVNGYNGSLMPGQPCTRAQIVTMLYRLLGN